MNPFPYDELRPVFMEELKALFSRFIEQNKEKKPYIFALRAPDYIAINHPNSYCLGANGNTIMDFESPRKEPSPEEREKTTRAISNLSLDDPLEAEIAAMFQADLAGSGYSFAKPEGDAFYYKYCSEEWRNTFFTANDFPKSNSMILAYIIENEKDIGDDSDEAPSSETYDRDSGYSEGFVKFRTEFFNFLIKCMRQLRDEKYFESVYPERVMINFEVREYFTEEEQIRIFEELNSKKEAKEFARYLYG